MVFPLPTPPRSLRAVLPLAVALLAAVSAIAQTITIDASATGRQQTIDGFGTCLSSSEAQSAWWQQLYYDDMRCSILRVDLTPPFRSPYSDNSYNSPTYHNSTSTNNDQDGNNTRTYTSATDYTRLFAGRHAQIAVMSPNIDTNGGLYDLTVRTTEGMAAQAGTKRRVPLGDFKLIGSLWSPAPWVKITSGNKITGYGTATFMPRDNTPWPFIWFGNFAGGKLDVTDSVLSVFNDGTANTSALTQFARGVSSYLRAFQNKWGVQFYAISIQNELNFETFYNSSFYPLSSQYIMALKKVRAELDQYPDLQGIKIMGPEDLLGGDAYGMWQYGSGATSVHKNLQYLQNITADPTASAALSYFCIHGYASDGVSSAGANPTQWQWWTNGWTTSPAAGIPANVAGFTSTGKKSWMTETSGEQAQWLNPATGFPSNGGWSIALKIHQALTTGRESAFVYWQFTDGNAAGASTLTDATQLANAPKLTALKHFSHFIRPGAVRLNTTVAGSTTLSASSYIHDRDNTLTVVLVNSDTNAATTTLTVSSSPGGIASFQTVTSSNGSLWQSGTAAISSGRVTVNVPAYGVVTLFGQGTLNSLQQWRQNAFNDPLGLSTGADDADADGDGASNLFEYAFNLDPAKPDAKPVTAAGTSGTPSVSTTGNKLQITYLRRKSASNPAINYLVEFANDAAGPWAANGSAVEAATSLNTTWERVIVTDSVLQTGQAHRFARVRVTVQ